MCGRFEHLSWLPTQSTEHCLASSLSVVDVVVGVVPGRYMATEYVCVRVCIN